MPTSSSRSDVTISLAVSSPDSYVAAKALARLPAACGRRARGRSEQFHGAYREFQSLESFGVIEFMLPIADWDAGHACERVYCM